MARYKQAPVYIGDVGEIPTYYPKVNTLPMDIDLSQMSLSELCNLAIAIGMDVRDVIGVKSCTAHAKMMFLGSNELPEGMKFYEDVVYCKSCWKFYRTKATKK